MQEQLLYLVKMKINELSDHVLDHREHFPQTQAVELLHLLSAVQSALSPELAQTTQGKEQLGEILKALEEMDIFLNKSHVDGALETLGRLIRAISEKDVRRAMVEPIHPWPRK